MNSLFIRDVLNMQDSTEIVLHGWVKGKRHYKNVIFIDLTDSTGNIQIVVDGSHLTKETFESFKGIGCESAVEITGVYHIKNIRDQQDANIEARSLKIISAVFKHIYPNPRSDFDIFNPGLSDHLLKNRHLYIRNPQIMAILRFRHMLMSFMRDWFNQNGFIEINAPILTSVPLYEDDSALSLDINGDKVFLTQCVGYYLEAAAQAFDRVYNMGPSFRGEESHSKRHLMEYWHIKAELTFGGREDIMVLIEDIIKYLTQRCIENTREILKPLGREICQDGLNPPYPRLSYEEAVIYLQKQGVDMQYGKSLGSQDEEILSKLYKSPFWVVGIPRTVEPFPYCIDQQDERVTMVADLIASNGYGELLGVAEKISDIAMLDARMKEKGRLGDPRYKWVREVHQSGCVPHIAFGMGVERLIRWLLNIPHVRDAIAFPRTFRRHVYP